MRAKTGSGGVGFFIKVELLNCFDVSVMDVTCKGILWLKLKHKIENVTLMPCVCYLPPEISSRRIDVNTFFDSLLTDIYKYQNQGSIFICGDFNARCGELEDFISGVYHVEHRNVVDFKTNAYGEILIDFLINCNMCILNGRNFLKNDFTSVSVKGSSVVDYCLVSHESLPIFNCFDVVRTVDLINWLHNIDAIAPVSFPYHSVILWQLNLKAYIGTFLGTEDSQPSVKCTINLMYLPSSMIFVTAGKPLEKSGLSIRRSGSYLWKLFLMMAAFHMKLVLFLISGDATSPLFLTVKAIVTFSL